MFILHMLYVNYLKATFDILRDENTSMLQTIKEIDAAYKSAMEAGLYSKEMRDFDRLLEMLPQKAWVE